tara:strand:+ start:1984 stop:2457 length:474 start_codon:yes stop_codon:yes gene_type:complete
MAIQRKIDSLEGALRDAITKFGAKQIAHVIGRTEHYVRNLSNPNQEEIGEGRKKRISHEDSIKIDEYCIQNDFPAPMIKAHEIILDEKRQSLENDDTLEKKVLNTSYRYSALLRRIEDSTLPESPKGVELSDDEKTKVFQAIKELEEHLSQIKQIIK